MTSEEAGAVLEQFHQAVSDCGPLASFPYHLQQQFALAAATDHMEHAAQRVRAADRDFWRGDGGEFARQLARQHGGGEPASPPAAPAAVAPELSGIRDR